MPLHLMRITLATLVLAALALPIGCKKTTEENVDRWLASGQNDKVRELIADQAVPIEDRARAVEKLVDTSQQGILGATVDEAKDKAALVKLVRASLLKRFQADKAHAELNAKDALLILMPNYDEAEKEEVREKVADWAFAGLSSESTPEQLKERIDKTQTFGQIPTLEAHGVPVATWLLAHGIQTKKLVPFLAKAAKTPELQRQVVAAVRRLFKMENLAEPWVITDMTRQFPIPETVDLLIDLYLNTTFDDGFRSSVMGAAQALIAGDEATAKALLDSPEKRMKVMESIAKLLASKAAYDRWDAAGLMFRAAGIDALDRVVGGFKADIALYAWYRPDEKVWLPDFAISKMCGQPIIKDDPKARPILEAWLMKGDRMQKAISMFCLKQIGSPQSIPPLQALTTDSTDLEDLFFPTGNESRQAGFAAGTFGPLTVGMLAQNTVEGITMLGELAADPAIPKADAELKRATIHSVFAYVGDVHKLKVQTQFERAKGGEGLEGAHEGASDAPTTPPAGTPPPAGPEGAPSPAPKNVPAGGTAPAPKPEP